MGPNNLVIVRGIVRSEATMRELASGDTVCQFDVRVEPADGGGGADVPASWFGAPRRPSSANPSSASATCVGASTAPVVPRAPAPTCSHATSSPSAVERGWQGWWTT
ncbi:hypothetical protein BH24ACT6_BH24ACT6_07160 [soil metagenome]